VARPRPAPGANFALSPDQELLRDTARRLLAEHSPTALVRAASADATAALWGRLRAFAGLAGGPLVDCCLFCEETGAALAPGPFFATVALFAPVVRAMGDEALFGRILEGEVTGTVAVAGPSGEWIPNEAAVKSFVIEADRVQNVAIISPGPAVQIVEQPPVRVRPTIDASRRLGDIDTRALGGRSQPLAGSALEQASARATVALAAELLGTTRWMFETTLDHVKTREQFGRPIGSFQALQHRLADLKLQYERAWSSVYYAAMCLDAEVPDWRGATHVAKASAGSAARHVAREAIQMHGGIGYTWDHDLHLYVRRAFSSEALLGTTAWHHGRLADLILDPA
jgi:alkylation response protein AidB-like acyl-CoA dehydrogenase